METLLLSNLDVRSLLTIEECIDAVEQAFRLRAVGKAGAPGILAIHAKDGGFHIKAGILNLGRQYFVAKTNANFPQNKKRNGLPTIQGVIVVSDAENGKLLALMDSTEVTIIRTGAATAIAAKYLSRVDAKTLSIVGCGNQGRISVKAIMSVRDIRKVLLFDIERVVAENLRLELQDELDVDIVIADDFKKALSESDICVTCTPARRYFIGKEDIRPGTFIAAVGSDNEEKQELSPDLLAGSRVVVDSLDQASTIGELHHALKAGVMDRKNVYAELGEVIAGLKADKIADDEIVVFDSTGTALQDVAAASIVYEKCETMEKTSRFSFAC